MPTFTLTSTRARTCLRALVIPLLALASLVVGAREARAQFIFENGRAIVIGDGSPASPGLAAPYGSVITVPAGAGFGGTLQHITVSLRGFTHARPGDLDVLLVPPAASGRPAVLLFSDVPAEDQSNDVELRVSDEVSTPAPLDLSGSLPFAPTNNGGGDIFPGLGPVVLGDIRALRGMDPAGDWRLYIVDDESGQVGALAYGWQLELLIGDRVTTNEQVLITSPAAPGTVKHGAPFPSTITVAGLSGTLRSIAVDLHNVQHQRPQDIEVLLKMPNGVCLVLMNDTGGTEAVTGRELRFETNITLHPKIPQDATLVSGTYAPTDYDVFGNVDLAPAAVGCSSNTSDPRTVLGSAPNGAWSLYVADDAPEKIGSINGWSLSLATDTQPMDIEITSPVPNGYTVDGYPATLTIGGEITPGGAPLSGIRWRVVGREANAVWLPSFFEEGPWQPIAGNATTFTLADIPIPSGFESLEIFAEVRDTTGRSDNAYVRISNQTESYTLAEGATGSFFDLDVILFNPTDTPTQARVQFATPGGGTVITQTHALAPLQRLRLAVDEIPGLDATEVATIVTAPRAAPLIIERAMFWNAEGYGGHAEQAVEPNHEWYFAEGAQGFFRTYLLLANPGPLATSVHVRFLVQDGAPVDRTVTVPARGRTTLDAGDISELLSHAFGIVVRSSYPIVAERAMYFSNSDRLWEGGHEVAGADEPEMFWLFAEGASGTFFDTFILVSNPQETPGTATMTFVTASGDQVVKSYPVPAFGRISINPELEDARLASTSFSTLVMLDRPMMAERAMYWPGSAGEWTEAHASLGVTGGGTAWGIADGRIGGARGFSTYLLLSNHTNEAAEVEVKFVRGDGAVVMHAVTVAAHSRQTVDAAAATAAAWAGAAEGAEFGAIVRSTNSVKIGVERATYWNAEGRFWSGGASALATRLVY